MMNKKVAELQKNKLHSGLISVPDIQLLEEVRAKMDETKRQMDEMDAKSNNKEVE